MASTPIKMFGFATGEVSVPIWTRSDIDKYFSSCRELENFAVDVTGKISRRKGAEYLCSHEPLDDDVSAFFYCGEFMSAQVIFLFWVKQEEETTLHCSRAVLGMSDEVEWVDLESTVTCDGTRLTAQSVRFRQYNDALFICGPGLPVTYLKVESLSDTVYPETATVTEDREERPNSDGTIETEKTADLVDSTNGVYEWVYYTCLDDTTPVLAEETETFDLFTQSVAGAMNPNCTYTATLNDNGTVTVTMTGTETESVYSDVQWSGDDSTLCPFGWVKESSASDYNYAERTMQLVAPAGFFKSVTMTDVTYMSDVDDDTEAASDTVYSATFTCVLTDEMYEELFNNKTVDLTVTLQLQATELEEWKYEETIPLETIESEECFTLTVEFDFDGWEAHTVQEALDVADAYAPTLDAFDFTVPPMLTFTSLDEGSFSVEDDTFTFPPDNAVTYSDKISRSMVRSAEVLALQDDSTESIYTDWGKWDEDGAVDDAKGEGDVSDIYYASGNTTLTFFSSGGRWCGQLALQVSYDLPEVDDDDCEWIDVGYITAAADGTLSPSVSHKCSHHNVRVRVKLVERTAAYYYWCNETESDKKGEYVADMGCKWTLQISGERRYYFRRTSEIFSNTCTVERLNVAPATIDCNGYSVAAFSENLGYPLTVDIAQQRLWFFSTDGYPKHFWGSRVDDIKNFATGSENDDGLCFEAETGVQDYARWLKYGKGQFQFGCARSEGNLVGKDNQYSLNPTSLALENESAWGSADADALMLADRIFFIKAGRKIISAQRYDAGRARFASGECNVLARHLFSSGSEAMKLAGMFAPESILFVLRADGQLARYAFNEDQNVDSWSRYTFNKAVTIEDIGVFYGSASDMLVMMAKGSDGTLHFSGLDETSEIYRDHLISADEDESFSYTSTVTTNAMSVSEDFSYGGRVQVVKLDVYGDSVGEFYVSFLGGGSDETAKQQLHFDRYTGAAVAGVSGRARCSWKGSYSDVAVVSISTDYEGEFELMAIGAEITRTA